MATETRSIEEVQEDLAEEFDMLGDVQEKQWHIIHMGEKLQSLPEEEKVDENRIYGCQSLVWVVPEEREGNLYFRGDSNSPFVKGLVALVLKIVSGQSPSEIREANIDVLDRIGLEGHTSFFRRNGFESLIKRIKCIAQQHLN